MNQEIRQETNKPENSKKPEKERAMRELMKLIPDQRRREARALMDCLWD